MNRAACGVDKKNIQLWLSRKHTRSDINMNVLSIISSGMTVARWMQYRRIKSFFCFVLRNINSWNCEFAAHTRIEEHTYDIIIVENSN